MTRETTRLSKDTTNAYARLRGEIASLDEEQIATRDAMYNQLLERRPEVALRQHVVVPEGSDSASAAALISPLSPSDPCALHLFWTLEPARQETILSDIRRVLENALEDAGHPEGLELRLDLGRAMEGLEPLLVELGWKRHGEREEFKTPVVELPTDWQGPLTWKSLDEPLSLTTPESCCQLVSWENTFQTIAGVSFFDSGFFVLAIFVDRKSVFRNFC